MLCRIVQLEKSRFVGFQALQALVYQLTLVVLGFLGAACFMCSFFGMFLAMPLGVVAAGGAEADTAGGILTMITAFFTTFLPFCLMGIFILIGFVFVLYGLYGAVRMLQGHDFRYAIVGRRLEQYLSQGSTAA